MYRYLLLFLAFFMYAALEAGVDADEVDPELPDYEKVSGVTGNLTCVGSDTLNNLMVLWSEGFRRKYPNVNLQVEGKGSGTAPPALIEGKAQLGPMSRHMKDKEIEAFERRMGYKPTAIGVALDGLSVFVHKDNPLDALTLEQLDAIFSKTLEGGAAEPLTTWGRLIPETRLAPYPISLYGRNSASGTYGYFKIHALFKGDFRARVKEQPGSASVVLSVATDPMGIGYSGVGYVTSGVKTLALSPRKDIPPSLPTAANVLSGTYPLGRMLLIYINKPPNQPLPRALRQFLAYVLTKDGQKTVLKSGYIPLPAHIAAKQRVLLDGHAGE